MSAIETVNKWLKKIKEFAGTTQIMSVDNDTVVCKNCKNSKVIINKDGKSYEYTYDENGKQTLKVR